MKTRFTALHSMILFRLTSIALEAYALGSVLREASSNRGAADDCAAREVCGTAA